MTTYYKITIKFPDDRIDFFMTGTLKKLRRKASKQFYSVLGRLNDPWCEMLGIYAPPISSAYGDGRFDQVTGALHAWSSYLMDTLTPEQIGMIWAYHGGSYTVEEVQA